MKQFYIAFLVLVFHFGHAAEVLPPAATISGPTAVCQNATGQVITFTGSGGTRPYTFTYTINGVLQPAAVTSASSNSVTVSIVTSTPGTFTYNLVSVHDNVTVTEQPINGQSVVVVITAAPTVDFSFNNDSTCSGTLIQFTSSVLGSGSYTYSWDFGDGSSLSPLANPTHSFTSLGCAILPFTVTLTVTAGGCTVTRTHTVSVKQKPDISFADPNATSASTEFSNCSVASLTNTVYSITVQNTSASSCISSYSINWGDNIIENNASFPISHTYTQLGVYNMVISATGSNGCSNSVTYIVKNISNPSAGVLNPGGTVDMCIPTPIIQYTIGNWAQNSPGTTYAINYGDGSPIVNLNQATMVASAYYNASNPLLSSNYPIPYSYTTNSCPGGDFIITLTVTNACRSTVGTVVGGNTRSKPLANFTNPTAACITSNVLFNNTTTLGYDSGCVSSTRFTWDFGDPASGTNNSIVTGWVTSAPNVNHTFSSTGVFTVTLTAQNGCGTTTKTQTICIEPPLVPLFSSPATGCASFNFTTTNNTIETNQCVPANYNWQVTYAVGNCGTSITPITDQTTTDGHFTFTEGGTYTIRLTASNSCPSQSVTQNVVVTKPPIVTAINGIMANYCGSASISPTANVTPCSSSGTLNYVWSFPGGVPVNPANLTTANPGTVNYASPGNYTVSVIVSNECGPSNTQTFSFNVNAAPVITNTSLSQSICSGTSTTSVILTASPSGTAFTWTAAATAGITGFLPGGTDTIPAQIITTSNTSQGTVTYTIIPTFNGCTGTTVNYSVIVNPAPEVTFSPAPQTICSGDNTAVVTLNSIASGTTFNWSATQPLGVTGVATSGTNTIPAQTLTNSTNIPIIITYNATATTSGSSSCAGAIYPYNITVKPKPSITESFTASTCSGSQFTVIPSNSALNTIPMSTTYSWPAPVTSVVMAGAIANNNEASIFGTVTNPTDIDQTATYTVTPSTNGCNGTPFTVTVTIHPVPTAANINPPAICSGDTFLVIPANGAGNNIPVGTTYTWTVSVNTNVTGQSSSNAPGVTSISQILTNTSNSNQTLNYTVTPAFGSCSGSTFVIYIIVRPKPQINIIASPQICSGDAFTVIPVNGSGNIVPNNTTYTWGIPISNPVGAVSGGSDQNTTQTNISQSLTNNTSAPATLTYNVMPTANGCIGNPFQIIVTVNPIPQAMVLTNQLYCNGASTMGIPFTNSVAGTTYTWTNSNPSIGLASSGTGDIPAFTSINTTNASTTATITVIASANGCSAPSQSFTITVNPAPTVLFSPSPQTLCSGTTSSIVTLSSTIIGATFSWTASQPLGITGVATNGTDTIPAQTLINSTDTPITITYNAVATTSSGSTCPGASYNYTITVNPNPTITEAFTATICSDGNFQVTPITSSLNSIPSGTTYSWAIPTVTGGITGGTAGINQASINGTLQNPTDVAQTATYSITPSVNGCPGQSFSLIVTINPKPTIANLSLPAICSNDTFSVTPVNGGSNIIPAGTTYTWTVALNNNITGQSDSGLIGLATISQTLTNNTSVNQSLIYTVTPLSGSCSGSNFTITVIVNPRPNVTDIIPSAICSGDTFIVTPSDGGGNIVPSNTTYTWSNPVSTPLGAILGGSAQASGQNTISQTLINTTNDLATLTYTVTPLAGNCTGNPFTITITLSPKPVISNQSSTICSTNTFTVSPLASGSDIVPLGTTYTWITPTINPPGSVTGAASQTVGQNNISQTLVNTTTSPATVVYTVTPASGICIGNTFNVTITVNPSINPNVTVSNNACFGVNIAAINTNITGGIPPYAITWTGPNGYNSAAPDISNLAPGLYHLNIIDQGNCPLDQDYTITEPADIQIGVDSENDITCYSANNGSINITVTGGTGNYSYTWTKDTAFFANTEDIANLAPGVYQVTVTDANNCGPKVMSFNITEPPLLVVNLVSQTNVLCYGASTGAITVNVAGGTLGSGYGFSWSGPNSFASANQNLTGIAAGTYNLTVTDANGCSKALSVTITQSTDITIAYTTTPITCYGANNASLSVVLSGGNPPYAFQWSNLATSLTQTDLSAGNYTITVTDNVGCIKTATIVIPDAPIFTVNPIVSNVSCHGAHNGSINLNLTGGIAPVALTWSDGSTAGLIRNNLAPGNYTATISDGTPCYIVRTFTIVEPQSLVLSANVTNAFDCILTNTGAIDLMVAGGTPPYAYHWSTGAIVEDLANITSGNYSVTVTDANNCTATGTYAITRQDPIAINVTTQTNFDCAAHTASQNFIAQVSGGIPPFQLQWSSGTISGVNNEIMHSDVNGTVVLTVTDANNCVATQTVTVDTPELGYPSFNTTSTGFVTYGLYSIGDPIQFQSTLTGDYISVSWDFGDGTFSTDINPVHTYLIPKDYVVTQTVAYPFGCVYIQTITLIVEKGYVLVVPTAYTPNNDGLNDTYRPVTKGLKNVVLDIYDTWGSLIYSETGDVLVGWDGKIKGFNAENGNYYSKVRGETFYGTVVNSNQTFVLIK